MGKKIVYVCNFCGEEFPTEKKMKSCEKRGIELPRFNEGDKIIFTHLGEECEGVIKQLDWEMPTRENPQTGGQDLCYPGHDNCGFNLFSCLIELNNDGHAWIESYDIEDEMADGSCSKIEYVEPWEKYASEAKKRNPHSVKNLNKFIRTLTRLSNSNKLVPRFV